MNVPNRLTTLRMILIPVMVVLYLFEDTIGAMTFMIMGIIFVIASVTDFFDGHIARKNNIVTTFGKFMDPLADKLLIISALLIFMDAAFYNSSIWMPFWFVLLIVGRELMVTSIRLVAVGTGKLIAASHLGKYKTALSMVAFAYYFFLMPIENLSVQITGVVLMLGVLFLTLLSGIDYLLKNKTLFYESEKK